MSEKPRPTQLVSFSLLVEARITNNNVVVGCYLLALANYYHNDFDVVQFVITFNYLRYVV